MCISILSTFKDSWFTYTLIKMLTNTWILRIQCSVYACVFILFYILYPFVSIHAHFCTMCGLLPLYLTRTLTLFAPVFWFCLLFASSVYFPFHRTPFNEWKKHKTYVQLQRWVAFMVFCGWRQSRKNSNQFVLRSLLAKKIVWKTFSLFQSLNTILLISSLECFLNFTRLI